LGGLGLKGRELFGPLGKLKKEPLRGKKPGSKCSTPVESALENLLGRL